jgi:alpha-glucuronidase
MRPPDDDGSRLWLRYDVIDDCAYVERCRLLLGEVVVQSSTATANAASEELVAALGGLLGVELPVYREPQGPNPLLLVTPADPLGSTLPPSEDFSALGDEGFVIRRQAVSGRDAILIAANRDAGLLYGAFAFIAALQARRSLEELDVVSVPRIRRRLLDHWDNLDGSIERGYAGTSLWDWDALPHHLSSRYRDYARTNASVGINGAVLTNVNANARVLTADYIAKVAALADVLRPYGIRVYLTARFSAPVSAISTPPIRSTNACGPGGVRKRPRSSQKSAISVDFW